MSTFFEDPVIFIYYYYYLKLIFFIIRVLSILVLHVLLLMEEVFLFGIHPYVMQIRTRMIEMVSHGLATLEVSNSCYFDIYQHKKN